MSTKLVTMIAVALSTATFGCSTTVRSLTATSWIAPPGGGAAPAAPAAPAAEGQAPAAAAPAAGGGGLVSQYYVTYWEGTCKPFFGCGRGDTRVKRCKVNGDNSVHCVEEAAATKALNPD